MDSVVIAANNGDGASKDFILVNSSVSDGESGVEIDRQIILQFSKNVVNISVKDNNMACFSMRDEQENDIALDVIMADDQIEREKRQEIIIVPLNKLNEAKQYTLTISENLCSKNGETLGAPQKITFSTKGFKAEQPAAEAPAETNKNNNTLMWLTAGIVAIAAFIGFMYKKKKNS